MKIVFVTIPLIGHANPLLVQARELLQRGHEVSLISMQSLAPHVERSAAAQAGLRFVSAGSLSSAQVEAVERAQLDASREPTFSRSSRRLLEAFRVFWAPLFDCTSAYLNQTRPDVLVADLATDAGPDAAERFGVPVVINNADILTALSIAWLPLTLDAPLPFLGHSAHQLPAHRFVSYPLLRVVAGVAAEAILGLDHSQRRRSRGLPATSLHSRFDRYTILVNTAFPLEYPRPLPANVHLVGPMSEGQEESLSPSDQCWLDEHRHVIYVNLGTLALAWPKLIEQMLQAFEHAPWSVWWVLRQELHELLPATLPSNVRIDAWGPPPVVVLSHPHVQVFVSHCGVNSAHEAILASTPVAGLPMFADQQDMAQRLEDAGVGCWLDKTKMTPQALRDIIERARTLPGLNERMVALRAAFDAAGGARRAASLIEATAKQAPTTRELPVVSASYVHTRLWGAWEQTGDSELAHCSLRDELGDSFRVGDVVLSSDHELITQLFYQREHTTQRAISHQVARRLPGADGILFLDGEPWELRLRSLMPTMHRGAVEEHTLMLSRSLREAVAALPRGPRHDLFSDLTAIGLRAVLSCGYGLDPDHPASRALGEALVAYKTRSMRPDPRTRLDMLALPPSQVLHLPRISLGILELTRHTRQVAQALRDVLNSPQAMLPTTGWLKQLIAAGLHEQALVNEVNHLYGAWTAADYITLRALHSLATRHQLTSALRAEAGDAPLTLTQLMDPGSLWRAWLIEVTRLWPVTQIAWRRTGTALTWSGGQLRTGQEVGLLLGVAQRRAADFDDPHELRPERWLQRNPDAREVPWMPFLRGPRKCIGRELALVHVANAVAALIMQRDLEIDYQALRVPPFVIPRPSTPIPWRTTSRVSIKETERHQASV